MSNSKNLFTVVIASLCSDARRELLERACDSVRAMAGDYDYSIIVVANGPRVSSDVLGWLEARPDTRVFRLRSGSYPLARRVGAELADSEFLAFLDDDDEVMPNTLAPKIDFFRKHPTVDVLVTDGLRINGSTVTKTFPPAEMRRPDLIETMMRAGWGASALTLRAQNIDLSVFDANFRHLEWTLTAFELAARHKMGYLDQPTYRYYEDTPDSLWKNADHIIAAPEVWRRLLISFSGTRYAAAIRRRFGVTAHNASWEYAQRGAIRKSWRLHFQSLRSPGGVSFLFFSAKLLFVSLRRIFTSGSVAADVRSSADR